MKIDPKCNKTVKYYPNLIYSKERCTQFKSDRNKHRSALSKLQKKYPIAFNRKSAALKSPISTKINKRHGALSKNTLFYECFLLFSLFAIFLQSGVLALRLFLSDLY